jgi:adenosylcobinamide-GDP ribazoletransferase
MVAATVPTRAAAVVTVLAAVAMALLGWHPRYALALILGQLAAAGLLRRCLRRFGGITGDVLGALVETAGTAALLTLALGP